MNDLSQGHDGDVISPVVILWLLAVALTFLLGFLGLWLFPAASGTTWGSGIVTNVAMAVFVGGVLGWMRKGLQVLLAVTLGSVVTVLGLNFLLLVPTPAENAHFSFISLVLFDGPALLVALVGMAVLVGVGAIVGALFRTAIARCHCIGKVRRTLFGLPAPAHYFARVNQAVRLTSFGW